MYLARFSYDVAPRNRQRSLQRKLYRKAKAELIACPNHTWSGQPRTPPSPPFELLPASPIGSLD
jgi:hypothetical protein